MLLEIQASRNLIVAGGAFYFETGAHHRFMLFFVFVLKRLRTFTALKFGRMEHVPREPAHDSWCVVLFAMGAFLMFLEPLSDAGCTSQVFA